MMAKPGACVRCHKPVTNQTILTCCQQPCHVACATRWRKSRDPLSDCFHCSLWHCMAVIEIINPQQWKEDPKFVEEVKRIWKNNPLWYGEFREDDPRFWGGVQGFWGTLYDPYHHCTRTHFLGHTQSEIIPNMKELNPPPTFPCIICKVLTTFQTILACCRQPCHVACADNWRKSHHPIIDCPCCPEDHSISVIELADPQQWKEDPQFVEEVERIWTTNPLWYGICHGDAGAVEGFWGTIYKPGDPSRNIPHFLGHTQSEVLPHMKALDPPSPQQIWGSKAKSFHT